MLTVSSESMNMLCNSTEALGPIFIRAQFIPRTPSSGPYVENIDQRTWVKLTAGLTSQRTEDLV